MRKFTITLCVFALLVALVGAMFPAHPAQAQDDDTEVQPTIAELLQESAENGGEFATLYAAVEAAGFTGLLDSGGPYTVFAPTNEAFETLMDELGTDAEVLLSDTDLLAAVLSYHVVPGEFLAGDVAGAEEVPIATFLSGQTVLLTGDEMGVTVNDATVTAADTLALNGVVHTIDRVLVPAPSDLPIIASMPSQDATIVNALLNDERFSTLVTAVQASPQVLEVLTSGGYYTVFAPTNEAFETTLAATDITLEDLLADEAFLTELLAYHAVPVAYYAEELTSIDGALLGTYLGGTILEITVQDGVLYINDAQVVETILTDEGIIHVVDGVLGLDSFMMEDGMEEMEDSGE